MQRHTFSRPLMSHKHMVQANFCSPVAVFRHQVLKLLKMIVQIQLTGATQAKKLKKNYLFFPPFLCLCTHVSTRGAHDLPGVSLTLTPLSDALAREALSTWQQRPTRFEVTTGHFPCIQAGSPYRSWSHLTMFQTADLHPEASRKF